MISFRYLPKVGLLLSALIPSILMAQATRFIVSEAGGDSPLGSTVSLQSGVSVDIRVTAVDESGNPVTDYARSATVSFPDLLVEDRYQVFDDISVLIPSSSFVDGVADNISVTPLYAGTLNRRVTVTDGAVTTYSANADGDGDGAPDPFSVAPASFFVGQAGTGRPFPYTGASTISPLSGYVLGTGRRFPARLVALNSDGTIATGYSGMVTLESTAFSSPQDVWILSDGFTDTDYFSGSPLTLAFNTAGDGQTITATTDDGLILAADASGSFDVRTFAATDGIAGAENVEIRHSGTNPGQRVEVRFTVKAREDAAVTATGTETYHTVTFFNSANRNRYSLTFLATSAKDTPPSSAENGATGSFSFTIPTHFPAGNYTVLINSGGIDSNASNSSIGLTVGGLPDLAITRFDYAPGVYEAGESIRFDMVWRNEPITFSNTPPNALAAENVLYRVEIHLSRNEDFGDEDDFLVWTTNAAGRRVIGSDDFRFGHLLPGDSVAISSEFKLPENLPGTYYLLAKVNSEGGPSGDDASAGFSAGFTEEVGPTPPSVLIDGNNIILANETQKITITPRTAPETKIVSSNSDIATGGDDSDNAVISRDGAYAVFQSLADFGGANGLTQIYRKNLASGQITLVSTGAGGTGANGASTRPAVNADGRFIVFESAATDLEPSDRNGVTDIYLRDMRDGVTRRLSLNGLIESNSGAFNPSISYDGRFVAFSSRASNLLPGTSAGVSQVYLLDRGDPVANGGFDVASTLTLVSALGGAAGTSPSINARVSGDGNYVVFSTLARNLHGGAGNPFSQVMRWDRLTGSLIPISSVGGALANGDSDFPVINEDGSQIAFVSRALNLTPGSTDLYENYIPHIFRATVTGGVVQSPLLRVNGYAGEEPDNEDEGYISSPDLGSFVPSISA